MRANPRIQLEFLSGPEDGKIVSFSKETVTLGRTATEDVALVHDTMVSRHHARLIRSEGRIYLEDAASRHGTFVNGQRVTGRVELEPGSVFNLGRTWIALAGA